MRRRGAGALAAAAILAAGCGSTSRPSPSSAPATSAVSTTAQPAEPAPPSKDEFIAAADKACRHTNRRLKPVIERLVRLDLSTQPLAFRLSGYRDAFHDLGVEYEDLISELQQLPPPPRDHRMLTRMFRLIDAIPLHLDRLQASITDLDIVLLIRAEIKLNQTFVRLGGTADAYGFRVCGVVPGRHPRGGDKGPLPLAKPV
jgi:hypothetical protein